MTRVSPTGRKLYVAGLVAGMVFAVASIFLFGWTRGFSRGEVKLIFLGGGLVWTFAWGGLCALVWPAAPRGPSGGAG